jgi:glucosamine 6-phosphate synthetase-like amidotransferase/phosphosugar isomerase protein
MRNAGTRVRGDQAGSQANSRRRPLGRARDYRIRTRAPAAGPGPEIGVASTKAFTTQIVAHYLLAAVAKGTDVDQPRNLAKSVTVE